MELLNYEEANLELVVASFLLQCETSSRNMPAEKKAMLRNREHLDSDVVKMNLLVMWDDTF